MHYLVKLYSAKLWLNTADVKVYFSQTVKCANTGPTVSQNCANTQEFRFILKVCTHCSQFMDDRHQAGGRGKETCGINPADKVLRFQQTLRLTYLAK